MNDKQDGADFEYDEEQPNDQSSEQDEVKGSLVEELKDDQANDKFHASFITPPEQDVDFSNFLSHPIYSRACG